MCVCVCVCVCMLFLGHAVESLHSCFCDCVKLTSNVIVVINIQSWPLATTVS